MENVISNGLKRNAKPPAECVMTKKLLRPLQQHPKRQKQLLKTMPQPKHLHQHPTLLSALLKMKAIVNVVIQAKDLPPTLFSLVMFKDVLLSSIQHLEQDKGFQWSYP